MSYQRQKEVLEMPNLIEVQKDSYQWFLDEGLKEVFDDISPIEDYSGSYELTLFRKDHENFMQYMQMHSALFLEGTAEEKYFVKPEERAQGKTAPWAFKLKKVTLLGNISDDILTGFCLDLTTPMLTQQFRQDLLKVIKAHKGKIPLNLYLYDPVTQYRIQFYSKKFQVAVTSEFIHDLHRIGIDKYEVSRR